ncbi:DUF726 domain-containing protein [Pseudomonas cichorii]|nr:DUF726 domain-containing protein [Pseudomonas cichorii]MBX8601270.1 DUF726 domain-containing protein [Pseudomonas cichorii]
MGNFVFRDIPPAGGSVANVFVHGYSAGHDLDDRYKLVGSLPKQLPGSINIFAFWDSGHISKLSALEKTVLTRLTWSNPIAGLGALTVSRAMHFMSMRSRAEVVGKTLLAELDAYLVRRLPYVERVNLIGHSLGGRVLVTALKELIKNRDYDSLKIDNVILMAAAVDVTKMEAAAFVRRVDGDIYNAYSRNDAVLKLNIDENSIGRRDVKGLISVEMFHDTGKGFGHLDYWPNLGKVLKDSGAWQHMPHTSYEHSNMETWASLVDDLKHEDFVRKDILLYRLLLETDRRLLEGLKNILVIEDSEDSPTSLAMAITDKFQLLAGNALSNTYRGHGISYVQALEAVALERLPSSEVNKCVTVTELETLFVKQACPQHDIFYAYNTTELVSFVKWYIDIGSPSTEQQKSQWGRLFAEWQRMYSKVFPNKLLGALLLIAYARRRLNCQFTS